MKTTRAGRFLAIAILAGLLATSLATAQKDDQAEVLMQAAHQKQLVEGQLEEAIQLYKRIVQEHAGSRAVAAKALLEMGQCYEKLGNTEARRAYERLLRDYGDQNEPAAAARKRLAALGQPAGSRTGLEMITRRVWAGTASGAASYCVGSISPDGRYLSDVDMTTGDLALRDLVTGKLRRLTSEGLFLSGPSFSVISPDGKQVAYNWFNKDGPADLRVGSIDGSAPRVLYANKGVFAAPTDWSPDGRSILILLQKEQSKFQIAVISVADGSVRVLKTLDRGFSPIMKFSPDGRYIAYDIPQREDSADRDIFLLAADGSREIPLVEHPADDLLLGWTPDGNHILFSSNRSGSMSAWMIRVSDGKPEGSPQLVKQDIGQAVSLGFTRNGAFYYRLEIGNSDIYSAEFDPATGRVATPPQKATQRFIGSNFAPVWSPDGQFLAYLSNRTPALIGHRPETLSIRSLKTGEERDLSPKLSFIWPPLQWSPDGRSILVSGKDWKIQHGLFQVDAQTGEVTPLLMWEDRAIFLPAWFPDGKRLLYGVRRREAGAITGTVVIRDLASGREKVLFQRAADEGFTNLALSPDGREVAVTLFEQQTRSFVLKLLPVAGGDSRELVRVKDPEMIVGALSWSPDSRYIVFGKGLSTSEEGKAQLFVISAQGGDPHTLGLDMDSVRSLSFDPTGHQIAFTASEGKAKSEIWVMENFLPALKAARSQPR